MNIADVKSQLPSPDIIDDLSELFKILGDQTRSKILFVLEQGEFCVSDISEAVGMTKYAVSHQLRTLKQAKLVKCRREGKEVIYSLDDDHVSTLFSCSLAHVTE